MKLLKRKICIFLVIFVIGVILITGFWFVTRKDNNEVNTISSFTKKSTIGDVIHNEAFSGFGHLIFPVDRNYDLNTTLDNIDDIYIWYNYIDDNTTVDIVNFLKSEADNGHQIFYPIYTEEEMNRDPDKRNVGLFFFRGEENTKTAIINAGGGFMYVGAMVDSFPHALELSRMGYNAFALIYRLDADLAMEDLARATAYLHDHAHELKIDMSSYSVWGGSAGGRMAAWISTYGTESFGENKNGTVLDTRYIPDEIDKVSATPNAVIMAYSFYRRLSVADLSESTFKDFDLPPTYYVYGTEDPFYRQFNAQVDLLERLNKNIASQVLDNYPHGFGISGNWATKVDDWLTSL